MKRYFVLFFIIIMTSCYSSNELLDNDNKYLIEFGFYEGSTFMYFESFKNYGNNEWSTNYFSYKYFAKIISKNSIDSDVTHSKFYIEASIGDNNIKFILFNNNDVVMETVYLYRRNKLIEYKKSFNEYLFIVDIYSNYRIIDLYCNNNLIYKEKKNYAENSSDIIFSDNNFKRQIVDAYNYYFLPNYKNIKVE